MKNSRFITFIAVGLTIWKPFPFLFSICLQGGGVIDRNIEKEEIFWGGQTPEGIQAWRHSGYRTRPYTRRHKSRAAGQGRAGAVVQSRPSLGRFWVNETHRAPPRRGTDGRNEGVTYRVACKRLKSWRMWIRVKGGKSGKSRVKRDEIR